MTKKCICGIYDRKLEEFTQVVLLQENEIDAYFSHVASDVSSPYFRHEDDFDVYRMYELDRRQDGDVYLNCLSSYIDSSVRDMQVITQTLNFLPLGYFRMPKEMQEDIQQRIKDCVYDYVTNHLADEQKLAISSALQSPSHEYYESFKESEDSND